MKNFRSEIYSEFLVVKESNIGHIVNKWGETGVSSAAEKDDAFWLSKSKYGDAYLHEERYRTKK